MLGTRAEQQPFAGTNCGPELGEQGHVTGR